jgi:hypothetical protein
MRDAPKLSFRDENRAMVELARELDLLRKHNRKFKPGDPQGNLLVFAEAALVCLVLEHFVRVVVGTLAPAKTELFNLLQLAVSRGLIRLPWDDQEDGIRKVCAVRNTLLHGNYAQAAREAGCPSVEDYFKSQFASEVEGLFKVTDYVMRQIDHMTGLPVKAAP